MKNMVVWLCVLCLWFGMPVQAAEASMIESQSAEEQMAELQSAEMQQAESQGVTLYEDGDVVGFIGDSITHARYCSVGYVDVLNQYYQTRFPHRRVELRNLGVAGYKAGDILDIYDQDPGFRGLNKAVIMLGTNEAILGFSTEKYINDMEKLVERLKNDGLSGEDIVIMTPPICDEYYAAGALYRFEDTVLEYIEALKGKAVEWGVQYLDIHTLMVELTEEIRKEDSSFTLTVKDAIHPSATGQYLIAYCILKMQGAENLILSKTVPQDRVETLSESYRGEKGMYRTWTQDMLPFAATGELLDFLSLYEPANDLYREYLYIEDFDAETSYQVFMGDVAIGSYTGKELEEGIDLAVLSTHPLQEKAGQLEELNRQWHKAAVKYRDIWIDVMMQRASYTDQQAQTQYDSWRGKAQALQEEMYQLAKSAEGSVYRMVILEEGYSLEELEQERIEEEEQARKEAEEQARREAEEQARKEAEEQARKEAEEQAKRKVKEQAEREAAQAARREQLLKVASVMSVAAVAAGAIGLVICRQKDSH